MKDWPDPDEKPEGWGTRATDAVIILLVMLGYGWTIWGWL